MVLYTTTVPRTRVQPGDMAHHFGGLDPRPVERVEGDRVRLRIGTAVTAPVPMANYRFTRTEEVARMAPRLTRGQLAALTELHREGTWSSAMTERTAAALVAADVARPITVHGRTTRTLALPIVNAYANGSGVWNVEVPASVHPADRAAVARAVIRGEVYQRESSAALKRWVTTSTGRRVWRGWNPRVEHVETRRRTSGGEPFLYVYREA